MVPPRRVGGNLDIRDLAAGTTLYLPVEVSGALFSVGDTHAAPGDGEVCGTAIESQMNTVLTIDLVKNAGLKTPRFTTQGPVTRHLDAKGYEVTTGVGSDLMEGARSAVSQMVDLLAAQHGMDPVEAYMLCSVCGTCGSARSSTCRTGWSRSTFPGGLRVTLADGAFGRRHGRRRRRCGRTARALRPRTDGGRARGGRGPRRCRGPLLRSAPGETLCIAGESGSGKSMTSLAIMGLLPKPAARIAAGSVRLGETDLAALGEGGMRRIRGARIA